MHGSVHPPQHTQRNTPTPSSVAIFSVKNIKYKVSSSVTCTAVIANWYTLFFVNTVGYMGEQKK